MFRIERLPCNAGHDEVFDKFLQIVNADCCVTVYLIKNTQSGRDKIRLAQGHDFDIDIPEVLADESWNNRKPSGRENHPFQVVDRDGRFKARGWHGQHRRHGSA